LLEFLVTKVKDKKLKNRAIPPALGVGNLCIFLSFGISRMLSFFAKYDAARMKQLVITKDNTVVSKIKI